MADFGMLVVTVPLLRVWHLVIRYLRSGGSP
jgi:hypothetical protein